MIRVGAQQNLRSKTTLSLRRACSEAVSSQQVNSVDLPEYKVDAKKYGPIFKFVFLLALLKFSGPGSCPGFPALLFCSSGFSVRMIWMLKKKIILGAKLYLFSLRHDNDKRENAELI